MSNSSSNRVHLWLRAESKTDEHRSALTPDIARKLIESGKFTITVEQCTQRIFDDDEYKQAGCDLVPTQSWIQSAPSAAIILGLKELNESDTFPLTHTHIHFAHCYKNQRGWQKILNRFRAGNGKLLDLEFLVDDSGRRVAAFGYMAGFSGAAIGLDVWCSLTSDEKTQFKAIRPYANESELIKHIGTRIRAKQASGSAPPKILIIGALGRCGQGAVDFLRNVGTTDVAQWDMKETQAGLVNGQVLLSQYDVFINCIYLAPPSLGSKPTPPFITVKDLNSVGAGLKMSVIVDVSCDPTNPNNPIPIYSETTSFAKPTCLVTAGDNSMHVVAIDHLPSLLPREASALFCKDLFPTILQLDQMEHSRVWQRALDLFHTKSELAAAEHGN